MNSKLGCPNGLDIEDVYITDTGDVKIEASFEGYNVFGIYLSKKEAWTLSAMLNKLLRYRKDKK